MKLSGFLLSFFALAFFTPSLRADDSRELSRAEIETLSKSAQSDLLKAALRIKVQVDRENDQDIDFFLRSLRLRFMGDQKELSGTQVDAIAERIAADKSQLAKIAADLAETTFDSIIYKPFTSSLTKFVGTAKYSGLLDDAVALLKNSAHSADLRRGTLGEWVPRNNEITVLKVLLLYMASALTPDKRLEANWLRVVYPAKVPANLKLPGDDVSWFEKDGAGNYTFYVPNAGYVNGGELQGNHCVGLDCSSFLSMATAASVRLSTWVMEYIYREQKGPKFRDDERDRVTDFKANWYMNVGIAKYDAVDAKSPADLQEGDLVVWRWTPAGATLPTGHVILFAKSASSERIVGIECNRIDDKSLEGVVVRELPFTKPGTERYVLRRKPLQEDEKKLLFAP